MTDLDALLGDAVEKVPRSGAAYRAEVVDGALYVVFRVSADGMPSEKPKR
jgi:hypothetical protein